MLGYGKDIYQISRTIYNYPGDEPIKISDRKFKFNRDRNQKICWLDMNDNKNYTSEEIVDYCFDWILSQISKKRLKHFPLA